MVGTEGGPECWKEVRRVGRWLLSKNAKVETDTMRYYKYIIKYTRVVRALVYVR